LDANATVTAPNLEAFRARGVASTSWFTRLLLPAVAILEPFQVGCMNRKMRSNISFDIRVASDGTAIGPDLDFATGFGRLTLEQITAGVFPRLPRYVPSEP
jgi:hypothetical protein